MELSQESSHGNEPPMSMAVMTDDVRIEDETPAQRRTRLQGYYDRAKPLAEEAAHSHNIPVHKPWSLSTSYFDVQLEDSKPYIMS